MCSGPTAVLLVVHLFQTFGVLGMLLFATGRFLREHLMSDHGIFSSHYRERGTIKIRVDSSRMRRALDGWLLARASASPAQGLHYHHGPRYFNFPYFCTMCSLEKLGLVGQTDWSVLCLLCC